MVYHYTKRATLARLLANKGPAIYVVHLNRYFVISLWYYLVVTFCDKQVLLFLLLDLYSIRCSATITFFITATFPFLNNDSWSLLTYVFMEKINLHCFLLTSSIQIPILTLSVALLHHKPLSKSLQVLQNLQSNSENNMTSWRIWNKLIYHTWLYTCALHLVHQWPLWKKWAEYAFLSFNIFSLNIISILGFQEIVGGNGSSILTCKEHLKLR